VSRPPAVAFDATGTLIEIAEPVGEVYRRVALAHGVDLPAWRLDDAFRRVLRHAPVRGLEGSTIESRRRSEVEWWSERVRQTFQAADSTARFGDFPAFAAALFDAYRSPAAWRVRTGARETLATLRRKGHPLGVVSNFDHRLPEILEGIGLKGFFDSVTLPFACGAAKPDRAIFEAAAEALGRPLDALLYVGDDAPDVLAAIADLGVRVIALDDERDLTRVPELVEQAATLPRRP
jgi:putative hydrolase of the HAD superfamily